MHLTSAHILQLRRAAKRFDDAANREASRYAILQRNAEVLCDAIHADQHAIALRITRLTRWEAAAGHRRMTLLDEELRRVRALERQALDAQQQLRSRAQRFEVMHLYAQKERLSELRRKEDAELSSQED